MNSFFLVIKLRQSTTKLILMRGTDKEVIDKEILKEKGNLSVKLLFLIDKLLVRNKISIEKLVDVSIVSEQDQERRTSARIVRTVMKTVRYGLTFCRK